jgi:LexA-binding, inner membrane-associated putative hydrolase
MGEDRSRPRIKSRCLRFDTKVRELEDEQNLKVATHVIFAECCWFASSAIFDVHYGSVEVLAVAVASLIPDAEDPGSWIGYQLGSVSKIFNRMFGHHSFLHSLLALMLITTVSGLALMVDRGQPGTPGGHLCRLRFALAIENPRLGEYGTCATIGAVEKPWLTFPTSSNGAVNPT